MKVNGTNNTNFGAIPDLQTRALLKKANMEGSETVGLEELMQEIHADKYVITTKHSDGTTSVDLCKKAEGVADLYAHIIKFDRLSSDMSDVVQRMIERLNELKYTRSKGQKVIDRIENRFGRYEDSYKFAENYLEDKI